MQFNEFDLQQLEAGLHTAAEADKHTMRYDKERRDFFAMVALLIRDYRTIMESEHGRNINPNFFNKV
jgi:hypothetical protein